MNFSYATEENSSFVVPPSRDYLLGHDESQHEIQNRKHLANAFLESGVPVAPGNRAPALPSAYRARGTLRSRPRCGERCSVASEGRSGQAVQHAHRAALGALTVCFAVRAT